MPPQGARSKFHIVSMKIPLPQTVNLNLIIKHFSILLHHNYIFLLFNYKRKQIQLPIMLCPISKIYTINVTSYKLYGLLTPTPLL